MTRGHKSENLKPWKPYCQGANIDLSELQADSETRIEETSAVEVLWGSVGFRV